MFLDIGAGELLVLVVLAVLLFGPEKVPEIARKAARVVKFLRGVANQATDKLKDELGPEYADLTPADLHPKRFLQRTLLSDMQADLDEVQADLDGVKAELADVQAKVGEFPPGPDSELLNDGAVEALAPD
jgi:sec-independent protein translocase protein TatB